MCGRFAALTLDEVRAVVEDIAAESPAGEVTAASSPAADMRGADAFPGSRVALIAGMRGEEPAACMMTWGFPLPGSSGARAGRLVYNTRSETAASSPMWAAPLENRRCVVPARAFYERHRAERGLQGGRQVRQLYRFTALRDTILLMAGIWEDGCFSIMTCPPGGAVAPVHDRMPVLLDTPAARRWLALQDAAAAPIALTGKPVFPPAPEQGQLLLSFE